MWSYTPAIAGVIERYPPCFDDTPGGNNILDNATLLTLNLDVATLLTFLRIYDDSWWWKLMFEINIGNKNVVINYRSIQFFNFQFSNHIYNMTQSPITSIQIICLSQIISLIQTIFRIFESLDELRKIFLNLRLLKL